MVHITDVLAVSMMLGITAQVKEAGVAWDKGEKRSKTREEGLVGFGVAPWHFLLWLLLYPEVPVEGEEGAVSAQPLEETEGGSGNVVPVFWQGPFGLWQ